MSKHSFLGKMLQDMNTDNYTFVGDTSQISTIIDSFLYLGSQYSTRTDTISEIKITHIISIGCDPLYSNLDVTNYKYDIEDNGDKNNMTLFFTKVIPEIHEIMNKCLNQHQKVLVHCQAGMSRSAIVIITWLMKYQNMDYDKAYKFVKERRPVISPNISFVEYVKQMKYNNDKL